MIRYKGVTTVPGVRRIFLLTGILGAIAGPAIASGVDLGVHGTTYSISEEDMRLLMMHSASKVDWDEINESLLEEARAMRHPNEMDLPTHRNGMVRYERPSWRVPQDVHMPVRQDDGQWAWELVYKEGTQFYLLDHVQPRKDLLIFDGRDEVQVEWALGLAEQNPSGYTLIVSAGDIPKLARENQRSFFAIDDWHLGLGVTHVPTRVRVVDPEGEPTQLEMKTYGRVPGEEQLRDPDEDLSK